MFGAIFSRHFQSGLHIPAMCHKLKNDCKSTTDSRNVWKIVSKSNFEMSNSKLHSGFLYSKYFFI